MAGGFSKDGAVSEQIDASIADAIDRIHRRLPNPNARSAQLCDECGEPIPLARQQALLGVRLCISCQAEQDRHQQQHSLFNRRGSKDSQLR